MQEGKIMQTMQGGIGIPHMHWCGQEEDYNFIVIEDLKCNFDHILSKCSGKFSLKTTLMLGFELISIFQYYHFKNFVFNNLSPRHLMMGKGERYGKIFIVDYSKSSKFKDLQTLEHIQ